MTYERGRYDAGSGFDWLARRGVGTIVRCWAWFGLCGDPKSFERTGVDIRYAQAPRESLASDNGPAGTLFVPWPENLTVLEDRPIRRDNGQSDIDQAGVHTIGMVRIREGTLARTTGPA
jgi:hypothetical protein